MRGLRIFNAALVLVQALVLACAVALTGAVAASALEAPVNDYPTDSRADYVFGCMAVNGQNRDILRKCSCSIDTIAEILPFDKYESAETIMSMILKGGERVAAFTGPLFQNQVKELKRAQVEAELRCF